MRVYNVGPDQLKDYDLAYVKEDGYEWLIYWYEEGYYDGSGEAVALRKDGQLVIKNLGHCSCYGPMEDWETGATIVSVGEFLKPKDSVHDITVMEAVMSEARKLLNH